MRITKSFRENIEDQLKRIRISPDRARMQHKINAFMLDVYNLYIPRHLWQQLKTHPIQLRDEFIVADSFYGEFTLSSVLLPKRTNLHSYTARYSIKAEELPKEFYAKFRALKQEQEDMNKMHETLLREVNTLLLTVNTVKKLREVWVNGSELIDNAVGVVQPTQHYPAIIDINKIDTLIGLPPTP